MENWDLVRSAIGAVVGFVLAQLVNVVKLIWDRRYRPVLKIELPNDECRILSHTAEVKQGEFLQEEIYGFYVRNVGRSLATGVRFQLIKIEHRRSETDQFAEISDHAYDLALYTGAGRKSGDTKAVLVPGAAVLVGLATWREDYEPIFPIVSGLPDYYEESCSQSLEFRFTVVAFDDGKEFVQKIISVRL